MVLVLLGLFVLLWLVCLLLFVERCVGYLRRVFGFGFDVVWFVLICLLRLVWLVGVLANRRLLLSSVYIG